MAMRTINNRVYKGIILGIAIRGSIDDARTFRVRPGNGFYNAILGERYQDQYAYFVPSSINNAQGQTARDALSAAVGFWRDWPLSVKKIWNDKAMSKGNKMSGYNLYIGEYVKANA